ISPNNATTDVNVTGIGAVTLRLTSATANCGTATDDVVLTVNPNPSDAITAPDAVCALSTGNTASVPNAGQGATYNWTITNGTITSGQGTPSITWTAGSTSPVTLNVQVSTASGCPATGSKQVTVNALPSAAAGPDQTKCQNESGTTSFTVTGVVTAGSATPLWSVFGTTGTAAATIISPNNATTDVNVTGIGAVTLRLTSATASCGAATDDVVLTVSPNPGATITALSTVCALSTGNTASVPNAGQGATYLWTITNGTITSGQGTPSITWTAGSAGSTTLSVTVSVGGGCSASGSKSVTVNNCNTESKGPGNPFPDTSEVSDQKAGSVLIYNFYTSSPAGADQDTRINITNISQNMPAAIHLFFVDGASCSVADSFLCLTPNQTASFKASDLDPGTSGYLVAVAVDIDTGCPISFNCLIGDEYVKLGAGHAANLGAEAFSALYTGTLPGCDQNSETANLVFNGTDGYSRVPRSLALSNIPSRADNNDTLLILNRIGGDLRSSASPLTSIFGILYNDIETTFSFSFNPGACQFRSSLTNNFPRTAPRIDTVIPSGRSGWMRFSLSGSDGNHGILGAEINFNPSPGAGAFNQGHNLHKLTLDTINTYTIPIIPPPC
ncbi:MAG TPA: hypothetical protein VKG02_10660, partial [Blastocatellia bacterium]|nr:hypothetical protein [Blastocatellia bacterium]